MAMSIVIPDRDWSSQVVTLGGTTFIVELKFKLRTNRWYMTLRDSTGELLLTEKKCVPDQNLTGLYDIEGLYGDIFIDKVYGAEEYPSRNNLGVGKEFELRYYTETEVNVLITESNEDW
ncbi:hypothetical protein [Yersinia phage vB_YenM_P778]